jgi:hypothetical protein
MAKKASPQIAKAKPMNTTTTKPQAAASAKPMAKDTSKAITVFVDPKALAPKGEGEKITKALCASAAQIAELTDKLSIAQTNKGTALSAMTYLFINAAKNDKSINLAVANGEDKKAKEKLFAKLRAVLGIIDVKINPDGTEVVSQSDWADEIFPRIGETGKNTSEKETFTGRETNRANFTARMREAAKGAYGVFSTGMNAELDKTTGKLAVSGKKVKEHFDQDRVILDERQKFVVDGREVNLKAKPSIAEIGRMGGAVPRDRSAGPKVNLSNPDQLAERLTSWQTTLEKLLTSTLKLDDKVLSALDNLADAIDKVMEHNKNLADAA